MAQVTVQYEGQLRCNIQHVSTGKTVQSDASKEIKGLGESFTPVDLVSAALGACISTMLGYVAREKNIDLKGMKLELSKEMADGAHIGKIDVDIFMPCNVDDKMKTIFERSAKSCPVHNSLHPDIVKNIVFHYPEA